MRKDRRLRVKVALRPRQRSRRNLIVTAVLCVGFLGAAAVAALRHMANELGAPVAQVLKNSLTPKLLELEVVGQPETVRQSADDFLKTKGPLTPAAAAVVLREDFPFMESVTIRRDWFRRSARLEFTLRSAAAPATLKGKPAGFVSDDGVVFSAPEGLFQSQDPVIEAAGASSADLMAATKIARAAREQDAVPSPMTVLRWTSAGWEAHLADGTEVVWGDGRWTADKLQRLREALADARAQPGSGRFTADLRYFEDGRVLLRPLPARAVSLR